jgi:hypothetical protein
VLDTSFSQSLVSSESCRSLNKGLSLNKMHYKGLSSVVLGLLVAQSVVASPCKPLSFSTRKFKPIWGLAELLE